MKKILKERNSKRNSKLFSKLLEKQGISVKELDVPQKTAWIAKEDDYIDEVEKDLPDTAKQKIDKFMKPMTSVSRTVDTSIEAKSLIKKVLSNVKSVVGDELTPQEIAKALKMVLRDMAADAKKVASDVAGDISKVVDQNEAHVVISPESDKKEDSIDEEEKGNPWAICTASVGREDEEKYEDCVKAVKKQNK
jgi:hypothetical protein